MDKWFHPTHCKGCNYLSMPGLKLNHVSKMGPGLQEYTGIISSLMVLITSVHSKIWINGTGLVFVIHSSQMHIKSFAKCFISNHAEIRVQRQTIFICIYIYIYMCVCVYVYIVINRFQMCTMQRYDGKCNTIIMVYIWYVYAEQRDTPTIKGILSNNFSPEEINRYSLTHISKTPKWI